MKLNAMKKFILYVAIAMTATLPGLIVRFAGIEMTPIVATGVFFVAILAAGILLSWGAEAAEKHVSQGLAVAVLALITVLPEYAVDIYFSYQAGKDPSSSYVGYAAANMTGANRLLIGMAWPMLVLLYWWRGKKRGVELLPVNSIEITYLLLASLYSFVIVLKNRIDLFDTLILVGIFGAYLWRVGRLPNEEETLEEMEVGPTAELMKLPVGRQWLIIAALTVFAAAVILAAAEPFAESLITASRSIGFNEFLLIQWLAPLASEAPAIVVAVLFAFALRPTVALSTLVSDKINQWTLLVGMIPLAFSAGMRGIGYLPLDARQHEEFFLTAAQSLFAVALILCLRLSLKGAFILLGLFLVQLALAFFYRNDEPRTIVVLTYMGWLYIALAAALFIWNRRCLIYCLRVGLFGKDAAAEPLPTGDAK